MDVFADPIAAFVHSGEAAAELAPAGDMPPVDMARRESLSTYFLSSPLPNGFRRFSFGLSDEALLDAVAPNVAGSPETKAPVLPNDTPLFDQASLTALTQPQPNLAAAAGGLLRPMLPSPQESPEQPAVPVHHVDTLAVERSRPATPSKASMRQRSGSRLKSPYAHPGSPFSPMAPGVQRNVPFHTSSGVATPNHASSMLLSQPPRPASTPAAFGGNVLANNSENFMPPMLQQPLHDLRDLQNVGYLASPAMSSPGDMLSHAMSAGMNIGAYSEQMGAAMAPKPSQPASDLASVAVMLSSMPFGAAAQPPPSAYPTSPGAADSARLFKCPKANCTKTYRNLNGLKYHLRQGRCEMDLNECDVETLESTIAERPYWCRSVGCCKKFKNLNGLKYHIRTQHPFEDVTTLTRYCRVSLSSNVRHVSQRMSDLA